MVASLAVLAAPAVAAGNLCTQMKAIAADAPNAFSNLRGAHTKQEASNEVQPPATIDYYEANGSPDGATTCDIEVQTTAGDTGRPVTDYACDFPIAGKNKGAATRKLATRIAACLGNVTHPIGEGVNADGGMVSFQSKDYTIDYTAMSGPAKPTIRLLVQGNGH